MSKFNMDLEVELQSVFDIIKRLETTSGSNDKIKIVLEQKCNEIFQRVLIYTYDKEKKYGISLSVFNKIVKSKFEGKCQYEDMFTLLDILASSNINDKLRREINLFYNGLKTDKEKELFKRVLLKKLQIGLTEKSINKAIPGLLTEFKPMKAKSYDKHSKGFNKRAEKEGYMAFLKKNGIRAEVFVEGGKVTIKSRQNKIIEGLIELEEQFKTFPDGYLFEGELLAVGDFETSEDQFKVTDTIISTKGIKKGIYIDLFDMVSIVGFKNGKYEKTAKDRKENLKNVVEYQNKPNIHYAYPVYEGNDISIIDKLMLEHTENMKEEGLMIILNSSPYECKEVNYHLKVKEFFTIDLLALSVNPGKEETTMNTLGSVACDYKGSIVNVHGWSDEEKEMYWKDPSKIIGRVIEVKYKAVTKDKNGKESLQFPNRVRVREEGKCISYE